MSETATMTLTEFLLQRIAEDEAVAQEATDGPWRYDPTKVNSVDRGEAVFAGERGARAITVASTGPADDLASMADGRHIARHDPARVLAEVEAKRRIVERYDSALYATATVLEGRGEGWEHVTDDSASLTRDQFREHQRTLRALAAVYRDHPDYDPTWAPS